MVAPKDAELSYTKTPVMPNVPFANFQIPSSTTDPSSSVKTAKVEVDVPLVQAEVLAMPILEEMKVELLDVSSL